MRSGRRRSAGPATIAETTTPRLAFLWERLVARLIDLALWAGFVLAGGLALSVINVAYMLMTMDDQGTYDAQISRFGHRSVVVWVVLTGVGIVASELVATAQLGGSVGKHVLRLNVLSAADHEPASPARAGIRTLVLIVGNVVSAASILCGGPGRRGWHDKAAGTVVCMQPRARKVPPLRM